MASNRVSIESIFPQFSVADVVATANYYHDFLGFEIIGFFGEPPVFTIVLQELLRKKLKNVLKQAMPQCP